MRKTSVMSRVCVCVCARARVCVERNHPTYFSYFSWSLIYRGKKNLPSGLRPKFPLDSFLSLLCCSKMINLRVLGRRESGKNLSDLVTEQSDDSSVTHDEPFDASFAVTVSRFFSTQHSLANNLLS